MSSILLSLPEIYNSYKNWVSLNPVAACDYETTAKWVSYFIAGRINNSHILSELVYCLSNLLVLFNDRIINNNLKLELTSSGQNIRLWLTVLEYLEVFLELSAKRLWGVSGKWIVIITLQVFKCVSRLILIYQHKESIIQTPAIEVLKRKTLNDNKTHPIDFAHTQINSSFTLKRSGRVVRKVDASPPLNARNWKPVEKSFNNNNNFENDELIEQALIGRQLVAETIYIVKPLVHLASMGCFGTRTWKPWAVALVMDLTSLQLYESCKQAKKSSISPKQKLQLSKRTMMLLLYLLRSPFYEKHSKDKINAFLTALGKSIPLANLACTPLLQYLPFWQSNYFYMWST